jgi:hypothetical protein
MIHTQQTRGGNLHWLALAAASLIFFAVGGARAYRLSYDFVPVYTGARCLLHGCNPYDTAQLEREFYRAGGHAQELPSWEIDVPVYPPSTFLVLSPLALLRYPAARLLWFLVNGILFVTSAVLVIRVCPPAQRWLASCVGGFILATSGILLVLGQPAALAISLVIIASYLFLRSRWLPLGAVLFMFSLAVKPQIGGLIVLYLLTQRTYRRYAAAALAGSLSILLLAGLVLQFHPNSAQWTSTLRGNLSATLSPGGSADPRPANLEAIGDTNLQTLTSIFFTDARSFNGTAYAIFLLLVLASSAAILAAPPGYETSCLAIGALAVLSLTPVYHRFYDTRLLLLTIPALLVVFETRRLLGILVTVVTILAVVSVQYRVQQFFLSHAAWQAMLQNKFVFIVLLRQQNLELLLLFFMYLSALVSLRRSEESALPLRLERLDQNLQGS